MKTKITNLGEHELDRVVDFLDTLPHCSYTIKPNCATFDITANIVSEHSRVSLYMFMTLEMGR